MEINLNLIPPYRKDEITMAKNRRVFIWQYIIIIIMIFSFGYVLNSLNEALKIEINSISHSKIPDNKIKEFEELKSYDEEFNSANSQIAILKDIQKERFFWSIVFVELNEIIPEGISLKSFFTKKNQVVISGLAGSRDDLVIIKEKLENSSCFENINFPLSNFTAREKIEFQLDFFVKDSCIKKL